MTARRPQLMLPAARRWPRQWDPFEGCMADLTKWMVYKGYAATGDEAQSLLADLMVAAMHGRLRPADAETETRLLDGMDRAFDANPALMTMLAGFGRQGSHQ